MSETVRQDAFMPRKPAREEVEELAVYNAECARGIVHTEEWDARMARIQYMFECYQEAGGKS